MPYLKLNAYGSRGWGGGGGGVGGGGGGVVGGAGVGNCL